LKSAVCDSLTVLYIAVLICRVNILSIPIRQSFSVNCVTLIAQLHAVYGQNWCITSLFCMLMFCTTVSTTVIETIYTPTSRSFCKFGELNECLLLFKQSGPYTFWTFWLLFYEYPASVRIFICAAPHFRDRLVFLDDWKSVVYQA
jgi:hypothetical protein